MSGRDSSGRFASNAGIPSEQDKSEGSFLLLKLRRRYPAVAAAFLAIFFLFSFTSLIEWNSDEDWQVCQYIDGSYRIVDQAGFYFQWYGEVWTYPKFLDIYYSDTEQNGAKKSPEEDTSIRVTFSDAGTGFTSHYIRLQILPTTEQKRMEFHRHFAETGIEGVNHMVEQHLTTCVKNSGPLMSASEYHAQRRAEYYQLVREQLEQGLYRMEVVEQDVEMEVPDRSMHQFSQSDTETVYQTRVALDAEKQPIQVFPSPIVEYGFEVKQYSITNTTYDEQTQTQLDARRESYQLAEQAKAGVVKEKQKVFSVVEAGKAAVALVESNENQKLKHATVTATQGVEVEQQVQEEEVAVAGQLLTTAEQKLLETEQLLALSAIKLESAEFEAREMISQAEATRAKLEKGGAVAEIDELRAEMRKKRMTALANLAKLPSPKTVIISGSQNGNAGQGVATTDALMQLFLLQQVEKQKPSAN